MEAASGFEPLHRSFADSSLKPLGYAAENKKALKIIEKIILSAFLESIRLHEVI